MGEKIVHLQRSSVDRSVDAGKQTPMVDSAQRMQAAFGFGNHRLAGGAEETSEKIGVDLGHIAGYQQNTLGVGCMEGRKQPAEGTTVRDQIGNYVQAQIAVSGVTNDCDSPSGFANHSGNVFEQRSAVPGQQSFVASHAGAAASGQHEPRVFHERIVAMPGRNRIAAMCFGLALLILAPLHAESPAARKLVVRADRKTGRLVTVSVSATKAAAKYRAPAPQIAQMVSDAAKANDIDPLLVHSVIQVESNYDTYAVSSAGARGLMQLMPGTARDLGVTDSFDPRQNIEAGVKYLKQLKDQYQDDKLALAAYNAGPGSVQKYKAVPPYPETKDYVQRVGERYVEARKAAGIAPAVALQPEIPQVVPQAPVVLEVPTEEKHARLEQFLDEYGRLHLRTVPQ
jgi:soluble lytic murein transglycosylase-like protein